jgi:hypothetical protein
MIFHETLLMMIQLDHYHYRIMNKSQYSDTGLFFWNLLC